MKTRNLVSLVISVLLLAACQPAPPGEPTVPGEEPGEAAPAPATPDALHGASWQLDSFGPADAAVAPGAAITLEFSAGGQVGGHSGCNDYGGSYTVQESRLHFTEIVSTLKACDDEALNDQEGQYLEALRTASHFALAGDGLTIWYGDEEGALRFLPLAQATASPTGSLPSGKQGERIRFPAEGNSVEIFAELSAGVTDSFVLAAEQGQILSVEITSPHNDVGLAVAGEDGTLFKHPENGPPSWAAELPATQDYTLQAVSVGQATSYSMRIWLETPATGAREEIVLEGEGTSITRSGSLPAGGVVEYVLPAAAGEALHVQTVGYHAPVQIAVTGPKGESWSGEQGASEVYIFVAQVQLPQDGEYVVTLTVPEGAGATHFDVAFTLATAAFLDSDLLAVPPERVDFEPGARSAILSGQLASGRAVKQYLLPASAGQTVTVTLDSGDVPVSLTLQEPGGAERFPEAFLEEGRYTVTHTLTVGETGDYLITLGKAEQTPGAIYELGITIR